ncbi:MAG: zinc ribbon domain-containing protein [Thermoanaerobaculia bacterium]
MTGESVTCPYSEPKCNARVAADARRCQCGRALKRCNACEEHNRAFANFCRACGRALSSHSNWTGFRGSTRRLGFNPDGPGANHVTVPLRLELHLGSECRGLLAYDGHLIAVSHNGVVAIADVLADTFVCRFQAPGPVTAQPCIRNGILYLAGGGRLSAYSLGPVTQRGPRVQTLWTVPLGGTPIHALTPVGDRLYVTVASLSWREVQVIENVDRPGTPQRVHGALRMTWVAADPGQGNAVFFSQNDGEEMQLHVAGSKLTTHAVTLDQLPEHPIAVIGRTVFGIFGEARRLVRIDTTTGAVEEPLAEDTQFFALSHAREEEWDRESVVIDSSGIAFSSAGVRDTFGPLDRAVKGSPLIIRNSAVVVGMDDGRVRVYDVAHLPRHEVWVVGVTSSPITALASFDAFIAAGNREGVVEVRALRAKGRAA